MEKLLNGLPGTECFYDDIVVAGKIENEVNTRLYEVLKRLNNSGLTFKREKCKFFKDEVPFLGYNIDKEGLHISGERVKAITDVPIPTNIQEIKAFLCLVNYYGKFVGSLSTIAGPLYDLLKKSVQFCWKSEQERAFDKIKKSILSNNVLTHYKTELQLIVACDASPRGIGEVLSHRFPDGGEKPITFASSTLNESETKYAQIDKEALALVFAVRYFHQYVYGRHFILITDHKPLVSIFG